MNEKEGVKSKARRYEISVKNGIKVTVYASGKKELYEKIAGISCESIKELRDKKGTFCERETKGNRKDKERTRCDLEQKSEGARWEMRDMREKGKAAVAPLHQDKSQKS
jgi:hypothetical protein